MARPPTSPPILTDVEPQVYVTDLARSLDFFVGTLGFRIAFRYGAPPFYAQVVRDGTRLNLRHLDAPLFPAELHAREPDLICASVLVSDARSLFEEFKASGAPFHQELARPSWAPAGTGAFIVRDPDGNLIAFTGPADGSV